MNIKKGKILKKMNLKEKKIIQCSYVDSEGKIYDVGYGDDLSPEISLTLETRQVSSLRLFVNNLRLFIKNLLKIPFHSLIFYVSVMAIYGLKIMATNNYHVYLTESFIKSYFVGVISIWGMFVLTIGAIQQYVLGKKVMVKYLAKLLHLVILYLVCCLCIKTPTFNIEASFGIPMYNALLELVEQFILIILNTIKDFWLYNHRSIIFNK